MRVLRATRGGKEGIRRHLHTEAGPVEHSTTCAARRPQMRSRLPPPTCTNASTSAIMASLGGDISDMSSMVTCMPRLARWS